MTLKRQGTLRPSRRLPNEIQPEIILLDPEPPDFLNEFAREEWRLVLPQLRVMGILATVDMAMITAYCIEWGIYVEMEMHLQKNGRISEAGNGTPIQDPMNNLKNASLKFAIKIASEFGFTPSSRTNIGATDKKKDNRVSNLVERAK